VPETLGGAGVQFAPKDLEYAAELAGVLAFDDDVRGKVIAGQRRRLADFSAEHLISDLAALVSYRGGDFTPRTGHHGASGGRLPS
jgi:hypothetical protein